MDAGDKAGARATLALARKANQPDNDPYRREQDWVKLVQSFARLGEITEARADRGAAA